MFGNKPQQYMIKFDKIKDGWGHEVIRVFKCKNYERIPQDIPICVINNLHNIEDAKNLRIYDIMQQVENYLDNSGE